MNRLPVKYRPDDVRYEKIGRDDAGIVWVVVLAVSIVLVKYLVNRKN